MSQRINRRPAINSALVSVSLLGGLLLLPRPNWCATL